MPEKTKKDLRRPLTQREAALQEKLNVPGLGPFEEVSPNLPPIERAPMFREQTKLIGFGTQEANELEKLYRLAPQLRGRVPQITSGLGPMYIDQIVNKRKAHPIHLESNGNYMPDSGLIALEGPNKGNIEIGNTDNMGNFISTLAHEFGHALGLRRRDNLNKEGIVGKRKTLTDPIVQWGMDENLNIGSPKNFGTYHTGKLSGQVFYPLSHEVKDKNLPLDIDFLNRELIKTQQELEGLGLKRKNNARKTR